MLLIAAVLVLLLVGVGGWAMSHPQAPSEVDSVSDGGPRPELAPNQIRDWEADVGNETVSATTEASQGYEDCSTVEHENALTALGCDQALDARYTAEDGDITIDLVVLRMSDHAEALSASTELDLDDFQFGHGRNVPEKDREMFIVDTSDVFIVAFFFQMNTDLEPEITEPYLIEFTQDQEEIVQSWAEG